MSACASKKSLIGTLKFIPSLIALLVEFLFHMIFIYGDAFKWDFLPFFDSIEKISYLVCLYVYVIPIFIIWAIMELNKIFPYTGGANIFLYYDTTITFIYAYIVMSMGGADHFYEAIIDKSFDLILLIPVICFIIRKLDREVAYRFKNDRGLFLTQLKKEDERRVKKREGRE